MSSRRRSGSYIALAGALLACGSATPAADQVVDHPMKEEHSTDQGLIADASASPVTFERIADFPPPGWQIPRQVRISPSGKRVTYLQSESASEEMALWTLDEQSHKPIVLLRAKDLIDTDKPMSREEELRRERQRKRIAGVSGYAWASKADVMLLPLGGNIYVRAEDGSVQQITDTDAPEIDPQICADGSKIAFARRGELFVVDVATKAERQLTKDAPEGITRGQSDFNGQEEFREPHGMWWSPSCDRIAYLEVDERKVATVPVMGFRDGADLQHLRYPRAGTTNPSTRIGVADLKRGATTWMEMPSGAQWDANDQYLGRVNWSRDGKTLFFQRLSRSQQHVALVKADPASGRATHIAEEHDDAWLDFSDMETLDGGTFLWAALRGGHRHIEVRKGDSGERVATLTEGAWDVHAIVGASDKRVLFVANKDAPLDRQLYAVPLAGGDLERLTSEPGVHEIEAQNPAHGFIDIHSSNDRLPRAVVYGPDDKVVTEIAVPRDADFDALQIRNAELVEVAGDPPLFGALLKPRHMKPGARHPLVVVVYGGPGVHTIENAYNPRLLWQHLADRGFVVWQLDNRGSTGRGHDFETPIHNKLGEVELSDQLRGLEHVTQLPFVDKTRVGIYGHSYGGYMAIMAMLRAPDRFKVGVSGSPVTDWRFYDTGYTERYMGTPAINPAGYQSTSILGEADKLKGKLFILHALMDENVHFEHTAAMVDAFVAADKDFDLLVFPGERHGYRSPKARRYAYRRVIEYFAAHL